MAHRFTAQSPRRLVRLALVEPTDQELFSIAFETKLPVVTDDHRFVHHARTKITIVYSTFFLTMFVTAGVLTKEEAFQLLEKLRDIRSWQNNIIYHTTKEVLERIE